jgi:hypothetical protein
MRRADRIGRRIGKLSALSAAGVLPLTTGCCLFGPPANVDLEVTYTPGGGRSDSGLQRIDIVRVRAGDESMPNDVDGAKDFSIQHPDQVTSIQLETLRAGKPVTTESWPTDGLVKLQVVGICDKNVNGPREISKEQINAHCGHIEVDVTDSAVSVK